MKIEFELESKEKILIFGIDEKGKRTEIGHIFTPSGSGHSSLNAIQICGFDEAFDLWGCGVFGDKDTGQMKKDIQLCWFNRYDLLEAKDIRRIMVGEKKHPLTERDRIRLGLDNPEWTEKIMKDRFNIDSKDGVCSKCFNYPCTCENLTRYDNPYNVKREQDLYLHKEEKKKE